MAFREKYIQIVITKNIRKHLGANSVGCVPSNFMANQQVPKFSLNNCAQSSKKTYRYVP